MEISQELRWATSINGPFTVEEELAPVYEFGSLAYADAYRLFVKHTNQKTQARAKLQTIIDGLKGRRSLIDVGCGDGMFTSWFAAEFGRTTGIEPNPYFASCFRRKLPQAELMESTLSESQLRVSGDLVLCANVMFHIPREEWHESFFRMFDWVAPGGALVMFLQSGHTECLRMLRDFGVHAGSLRDLKAEIDVTEHIIGRVTVETLSAYVETNIASEAYEIGDFMLNMLPPSHPPTLSDFKQYVDDHFRKPTGQFKFSCDLDCLIVQR